MKKLLLILLTLSLITSCDNEQLDADNQDTTPTELILKEVTLIDESLSNPSSTPSYQKFHYDSIGRPTQFEFYEDGFDGEIPFQDVVTFNENGKPMRLDSYRYLENGLIKFFYNNNQQLSRIEQSVSAPVWSFDIIYIENIIQVTENPTYVLGPTYEYEYTFSNEDYDNLMSYQRTTIPYNSDEITVGPLIIREYEYDSNTNVTSKISKIFNSITQQFEISSTTNYTYDSKPNPYKNTLTRLTAIDKSLVPLGTLLYRDIPDSANNILSKIKTNSYLDSTETTEYEYNQLEYPTSSIKTIEEIDVETGEQLSLRRITKTYTYY